MHWSRRVSALLIGLLSVLAGGSPSRAVEEWKSGIPWIEPPVVDPGEFDGSPAPPSDAIILFDGRDLSQWQGGERWKIADGVATAAGGGITTRDGFGDCQLHLEFNCPPEDKGQGQGRGNSGVYLMGRYEVQILDSYENKTYFDGQCGAIYKQSPPLVNASRPPGQWQSFDIHFTAPRFDEDGRLVRPGRVSVLHNGMVVQNNWELLGGTSYTDPPKYTAHPDKQPLSIQFHGDPVRFRNIWIRDLTRETPKRPD
jgi:hypothetical protein